MANLNKVGLPVFLKPIIDTIPIANPTKNPTRFKIFSNKNSNCNYKYLWLIILI